MRVAELATKVAQQTEVFQSQFLDALKADLKELFDADPNFLGLVWTQYTPGFNDGEPCVFGLGEAVAVYEPAVLEDVEPGDLYGDEPGLVSKYKFTEALKQLWGSVSNLPHQMERTFGNNVKVRATRAGFDVSEYDCGY